MSLPSILNPRNWFAATPAPTKVAVPSPRQMLRARFDSQFTTDENKRHWALADALSIDAAASWQVRRVLRMRNRYEYHNNSYYFGIAETIGDYVIGTGPRLQMRTANKTLNAAIEAAWTDWAREVCLADTLRTMRIARVYNGEGFALIRSNPGLTSPIKLDLFQVEADQVSSPLFGMYPQQYPDQFFDGVVLDRYGRPMEYHVLRQHPGAFGAFVVLGYVFDKWPARYVVHDFKRIRPGQQRGIPEATPALPQFASLRRYQTAVLAAAETAAEFPIVIKTDAPADADNAIATGTEGEEAVPDPFETVNLGNRAATVMPTTWDINQVRAEQPTTTYDAYETAVLRQICRALKLPLMFGTMDAQQANMSSAYIVAQPFAKAVQVDRMGYDGHLDRVFDAWLEEALKVNAMDPTFLPGIRELPDFPHQWMWPNVGEHADPAKVAAAQQVKLIAGTTTRTREYAKQGLDVDEEDAAAAKELGCTIEEYRGLLRQKMFAIPSRDSATNPPPEQTDDSETPASEDETGE